MFLRLQKRWGVSGKRLFWIILVFAVTGTTTAFLTRVIAGWMGLTTESFWLWKTLLQLGVLIFGYQAILLLVAFTFGQFSFFWQYEKKILRRLRLLPPRPNHSFMKTDKAVNIAIFASGAGTNAQQIIRHFIGRKDIVVALIVSNKEDAGALEVAEAYGVPSFIIEKERFLQGDAYLPELNRFAIDFIVLAGFLWKVPAPLVKAYEGSIINIHPALLPSYGGKGMYGNKVHEAVIRSGDKESGISIHYVNERYDEGGLIFQVRCPVLPEDSPETLAQRIHHLEHTHFPRIIEELIQQKSRV